MDPIFMPAIAIAYFLLKKTGTALKPVVKKTTNQLRYITQGERWWIVGPMGAGKTTMHRYLENKPSMISHYETTNQYDERGKGCIELKKTSVNGAPDTKSIKVYKKAVKDHGGQVEYWNFWKDNVKDMHRFVFLYSLDLNNEMNFPTALTMKNGEIMLQPTGKGFKTIKDCLRKTLKILIENFPKDQRGLKQKHKTLLLLCGKADQWFLPNNTFPSRIPFYQNALKELKEVVKKSKFEEKTGFKLSFGYTTFNMEKPEYEKLANRNMPIIFNEFINKK